MQISLSSIKELFLNRTRLWSLSLILLLLPLASCQIFHPYKASEEQFNAREMPRNVNVAMALSSGGVRAIAQLGVIDVLEKNGIGVDLITGTSGGAIIGALYADSLNAFETKERLKRETSEKLITSADISVTSFVTGMYKLTGGMSDRKLARAISKNISVSNIEELKMPMVAVATDVNSGTVVGFRGGNIFSALRASSAIPGVFSPVILNDMTLVDGGVLAPIPVEITRQFSPKISIAVDTTSEPSGKINSTLGVTIKSLKLTLSKLRLYQGREADILIRPEIDNVGFFAHNVADELFSRGQEAAIRQLPEIKRLIRRKIHTPKFTGN